MMKFYVYLKAKTQTYIPRLWAWVWAWMIPRCRPVFWPCACSLFFLCGGLFLYPGWQDTSMIAYVKAYIRMHYFSFLPQGWWQDCPLLLLGKPWIARYEDLITLPHCQSELISVREYLHRLARGTLGVFLVIVMIQISYKIYKILECQRNKKRDLAPEQISGTQLIGSSQLIQQIRSKGGSNISLGGVPLPTDRETQSLLLLGGRSVVDRRLAIQNLVEQLRASQQKIIIVDPQGDFISRFYDAGQDIILSPWDVRMPSWNVWEECRDASDFECFLESFISQSIHSKLGSCIKSVFSTMALQLKQENRASLSDFLRHLRVCSDMNFIRYIPDDHLSVWREQGLDMSVRLAHVRAMLSVSLGPLAEINMPARSKFFLRDWLEEEGSGCIFVSSPFVAGCEPHPLMTAWLNLGIHFLLAQPPDATRRRWFVMADLPILGRLPLLIPGLSSGAAQGACFILGAPDWTHIQIRYNQKIRPAMIGTIAVFTVEPLARASALSTLFGEQTVAKQYCKPERRAVVRPSLIQALRAGEAYLMIRDFSPTRIRFENKDLPQIVAGRCVADKNRRMPSEPQAVESTTVGRKLKPVALREVAEK